MSNAGSELSRHAEASGKLKALREAAQIGFDDLSEGRFLDVAAGDLDALIGNLGRRTGNRPRGANR